MELAGGARHFTLLAADAAADVASDACDPSETRVRGIDLAGYAGTWSSTLASAETHWDSTCSYGELAADRQEVTNLRLPGQYDERLLGSLGLQGPYYNWNRWYLPSVGRYLEPDPIAMRGRFNSAYWPDWYAYAEGNPLRYVDPMGLASPTLDWLIEYAKKRVAKWIANKVAVWSIGTVAGTLCVDARCRSRSPPIQWGTALLDCNAILVRELGLPTGVLDSTQYSGPCADFCSDVTSSAEYRQHCLGGSCER